ncbi:MAG TPA: hypothetical protein VJL86_08960 [Steroidobacteraceae bacterium]|nr:hypothetical protein [Steroidobacteraceae bacterium]
MPKQRHFGERCDELSRDDFMGQRKGPWPQPAPDSPVGMAAEVLHPPEDDLKLWKRRTQRYYIRELVTKFPLALYNWFFQYRIDHLSDQEVAEMMTTSSYSKFLRKRTAAELRDTIFHERLAFADDVGYLISDFTTMKRVKPKPGMYAAPTVSLFAPKPGSKDYECLAIAIGHQEGADWRYVVLMPGDEDAWMLAKYFVIQGASHMICLSGHPASHFPYDTVNAVTVTALPKDHTLFRLLEPHLPLHLSVDHSVLQGRASIVSQSHRPIYSPFVGTNDNVRALVPTGYRGCDAPQELSRDPGCLQRQNYRKWSYPKDGGQIPSDYGRVLRAYYATVRRFVVKVVNHIATIADEGQRGLELHFIRHWADYIEQWLPGFPDEDSVLVDGDAADRFPNLTTAVTTYIWAVAVAHSLEHATFHRLGPHQTSFRLRVPPPTSRQCKGYARWQLVYGWDIFKATLAFEMFFKPHVIYPLADVQYRFHEPALAKAAAEFRADLAATDQALAAEGVRVDRYIRHHQLSTSIQY